MAAQRPVTLVYEEFATLHTTPATPELECLIAGATYFIQDFPDDRANILLTQVYGQLNAPADSTTIPPVAHTVAIDIANPPNVPVGAILDPASVKVYFSNACAILATGTDGTVAVKSNGFASAATDLGAAGVQAGDLCILTDGSENTLVFTVTGVSAKTCTFTSDIPSSGFVAGTVKFRFERALTEQAIASSFVNVVADTNEIQILGGVTLPIGSAQFPISYAKVYVAYRALRQDLAKVTTLNSPLDIPGTLGRIDARNPGAAGAFVAMENTSSSILFFGVQSNDEIGFADMQATISTRKDVYAVVPLITNLNVVSSFASENTNLADVNYALTNGVPQKFRVVIGAPSVLPTETILHQLSEGFTEKPPTGAPRDAATRSIVSTITVAGADFTPCLPGDLLVLSAPEVTPAGWASASFAISHVISATVVEVDVDVSALVKSGTNTVGVTRNSAPVITPVTGVVVSAAASAPLFLDLYDPNGTFIHDGIIPGDYIEIPHNCVVTGVAPNIVVPADFTAADRYEIAAVVSNQRLRISQAGSIPNTSGDTSLLANELPHNYSRYIADTLITLDTTKLSYRVTRTLDLSGQATALVAIPTSLANRRAVICWPDQVTVAGLVDGSLPRASTAPGTPVAAGLQPGFYLAAAVGGMTAALPSHQGFTNLSINGISEIFNSNRLFTDTNLTQISNSGWFVFAQDVASALPYCVHQLTTDVSTLEFSEFSMVKNMDYVAIFFSDIVNTFIGPWNVNPETLGFMGTAVNTGITSLKLQKYPKIGARIISAAISQLAQSTLSKDRVECYIECDFPAPLNTVGLHIVSV